MTDQIEGRHVLKGVLRVCSLLYGIVVHTMRQLYLNGWLPRYALGRPVISVGNITWGGAGKTPLVQLVTRFIREKEFKPAVLIRGYQGSPLNGSLERNENGDEAEMLRSDLDVPLGIGRDRVQKARAIQREHRVDLFILDDGFQQWRITRDLDIVVVDASNPFGNGYLIPRGIMRESLLALSRADIVVISKADRASDQLPALRKKISQINARALVVESTHQPHALTSIIDGKKYDLSHIKGKRIAAFCGIGEPGSFESSLSCLQAKIAKLFTFPDHHRYQRHELEGIVSYCRKNRIETVVMTDKDAVKVKMFSDVFGKDIACLSLSIKIEILKGENEFFNRIVLLLRR